MTHRVRLLFTVLLGLCVPHQSAAQTSGILNGQAGSIAKTLWRTCSAGQVLVKDTSQPYGVACAAAGGGGGSGDVVGPASAVDGNLVLFNGTTGKLVKDGGVRTPLGAQYWTGAADTDLTAEKNLGALATGLVINTSGVPSPYAGTSCTNQFPRSLSASGAATCASVAVGSDVSGFGTGVATALGVNVGSAGAFVTFNGALGTPSSGTLTNATGLPISTGVSGLGTNVGALLATFSSANLAAALTDETGSGLAVLATAPAFTTSTTLSNNGIGAVSTDGVILQNTTAAAAGAQQWSPRLHLIGQGWKTTATAASQTTDWIIENQPVQGTTNPTTNLVFSSQVNAGGYGNAIAFNSAGQIVATNGSSAVPAIGWNIGSNNIGFYRDSNSTLIFTYNGSDALGLKASSLTLGPSTNLAWGSSAISNPDLFLFRDAAATLAQRNATNAQAFRIYETFTDASNYERYNFTSGSDVLAVTATSAGTGSANLGLSFAPKGSGFVTTTSIATAGSGMAVANVGANSCGTTAATIAGNDNVGEITVGATAGTQCRITFTKAAPNRWDCSGNNETTGNLMRPTYVDSTHVDISGTMSGGDVVNYHCFAR